MEKLKFPSIINLQIFILGLNISSLEPGGCVLLRALEPLEEKETMTIRRLNNKKKNHGKIKDRDLCSGPSKLCQVCLNTLCTSHYIINLAIFAN